MRLHAVEVPPSVKQRGTNFLKRKGSFKERGGPHGTGHKRPVPPRHNSPNSRRSAYPCGAAFDATALPPGVVAALAPSCNDPKAAGSVGE
jgi:hypothetical protein